MKIIEESFYYAALCSFHSKNYYRALSEFTSLLINFPNTLYIQEAKMYSALSYFYTDDYFNTLKTLKQYVKIYPEEKENQKIKKIMAPCYYYEEYYDQALSLFEEIIKKDSNDILMIFFRAQIYFYNKEYKKAESDFDQVIKSKPEQRIKDYASFFMGAIHFYKREYQSSDRIMESLINSDETDQEIRTIAQLYLKSLKLSPRFLNQLIEENKNKELLNFAYLQLFQFYIKKKQYSKAQQALNDGMALNIRKDYYFRFSAQLHSYLQDPQEIENMLKLIINDHPESPFYKESQYNLAVLYLNENKIKKAKELFLSLKKNPLNKILKNRVQFHLGVIEYRMINFSKAEKHFNTLLKQKKLDEGLFSKILSYKSAIHIKEDKHQENIRLLSSVDQNQLNFDLKYNLAYSYFKTQAFQKALSILDYLLDHSEDENLNIKAFKILAKSCSKSLNNELFAKHIHKFRNNKNLNERQYITYTINLAEIYIKRKKTKEAEKTLLYCVTLNPDDQQKQRIHLKLYQIYVKKQKLEKAITSLNTAIPLFDDDKKTIYYLYLKAQLYKELNNQQLHKETLNTILSYEHLSEHEIYIKVREELNEK